MGKVVHTLGSKKKSQIASLGSDKLRPRLKPTEATDAVAAKDCRKLPNVLVFPPPPHARARELGKWMASVLEAPPTTLLPTGQELEGELQVLT